MVKYLLKLDVNSAYYDPKTCSMVVVLIKCFVDTPTPLEEKKFATWGTDVLDQKKLVEALKKVSPEEMVACRMKMIHRDDPVKAFLH
ncbi:putative pre-mRNA splicing Prp18-interacting factor [Medicago truncatula]|uniref:Putative pre-mRNA splicing Prp18-interacting factor n=1 Tax=Medicago truncatula TaxID=3880 RepID=A0A396K157_MEDTR|nr:putative pre-mRNA splicing Prp18-interacting factor [Medicago truncatula]